MKKLFRLTVHTVGLLILVQCVSVVTAKAQLVNEIFKRMEAHYQALSTLKADVKMEQFTSQTGENDVKDGRLVYVPQKGRDPAFRIEWTKPAEQLSVKNGRYKMYRVNLKVAYTGSVDGVGKGKETNSVLVFLNLSKEQLKAAFVINYVATENVSGGTPTWHLQLIPRSGVGYKNADIWVSKDGMPLQMRQTEKNGDTTTVLLSNLSENTQVDMSKIEVVIPKGVKINKT